MKTVKNSLKNIGLVRLIVLFVMTFIINIFSMKVSERAKNIVFKKRVMQKQKEDRLQRERDKKHELGKYFIYEKGTSNGILVDAANAEFFSETIKNMVEGVGGKPSEISLPFPANNIKLSFDFLNNVKRDLSLEQLIKGTNDFLNNPKRILSLKQLIGVANLFNYLDVPIPVQDIVFARIKKDIATQNDIKLLVKELEELNPDVQKQLMTILAINCLKNFIIKKYAKNRNGKALEHHVAGVAFSPDGKKFVSWGYELILWDISNSNNITHKKLLFNVTGNVKDVAFSPDGKLFVSGYNDNLFLWNISNLNMISLSDKSLVNYTMKTVNSVAFSSDGTKIISGGAGRYDNSLILWDISDPDNITHKVLKGHTNNEISSVAFSPDNTKIISGSYGKQNNLILWNISDINNITYQELVGQPSGVYKVIFNPNGKSILSSSQSIDNSLFLWDITNENNITYQVLPQAYITSMAFNSNGTKIASGTTGVRGDNLILWDISNQNNITHKSLIGLPHTVNSVAFSPDDKSIVAGCWNLNDPSNLVLWDISNPNNITHQKLVGQPHAVEQVAFSPDGTKILSVGGNAGISKLMLSSLLTHQEELLLQELQNYTINQVKLIYIFCLKALNGEAISLEPATEEYKIFMTLPEGMQKLLQDLLFSQGWFSGLFSGWWK